MTDGQISGAIFSLLCLVLVISSLAGRRIPLSFVAKSALGWAAIVGLAYIGVTHRGQMARSLGNFEHWVGLGDQQTEGREILIRQSDDGHFYARVTINGYTNSMLIDSGATTTALSEATAKAAGIDVDKDRESVELDTANGTIEAWRANVAELSIDGLSTKDIEVVVAPNFGDADVIGMNFLSRLKSWRVEGGTLILDPVDGEKQPDPLVEGDLT